MCAPEGRGGAFSWDLAFWVSACSRGHAPAARRTAESWSISRRVVVRSNLWPVSRKDGADAMQWSRIATAEAAEIRSGPSSENARMDRSAAGIARSIRLAREGQPGALGVLLDAYRNYVR